MSTAQTSGTGDFFAKEEFVAAAVRGARIFQDTSLLDLAAPPQPDAAQPTQPASTLDAQGHLARLLYAPYDPSPLAGTPTSLRLALRDVIAYPPTYSITLPWFLSMLSGFIMLIVLTFFHTNMINIRYLGQPYIDESDSCFNAASSCRIRNESYDAYCKRWINVVASTTGPCADMLLAVGGGRDEDTPSTAVGGDFFWIPDSLRVFTINSAGQNVSAINVAVLSDQFCNRTCTDINVCQRFILVTQQKMKKRWTHFGALRLSHYVVFVESSWRLVSAGCQRNTREIVVPISTDDAYVNVGWGLCGVGLILLFVFGWTQRLSSTASSTPPASPAGSPAPAGSPPSPPAGSPPPAAALPPTVPSTMPPTVPLLVPPTVPSTVAPYAHKAKPSLGSRGLATGLLVLIVASFVLTAALIAPDPLSIMVLLILSSCGCLVFCLLAAFRVLVVSRDFLFSCFSSMRNADTRRSLLVQPNEYVGWWLGIPQRNSEIALAVTFGQLLLWMGTSAFFLALFGLLVVPIRNLNLNPDGSVEGTPQLMELFDAWIKQRSICTILHVGFVPIGLELVQYIPHWLGHSASSSLPRMRWLVTVYCIVFLWYPTTSKSLPTSFDAIAASVISFVDQLAVDFGAAGNGQIRLLYSFLLLVFSAIFVAVVLDFEGAAERKCYTVLRCLYIARRQQHSAETATQPSAPASLETPSVRSSSNPLVFQSSPTNQDEAPRPAPPSADAEMDDTHQ